MCVCACPLKIFVVERHGGLLQSPKTGAPLIPNWNRITSAIPDFLGMLHEAVEQDSAIATYAGGTTR